MSEMIERVARAIYAAEGNTTKEAGGEWRPMTLDDEEEQYRSLYYDYARAAIEAMREPTQAMIIAGHEFGNYPHSSHAAMIDAALKENP